LLELSKDRNFQVRKSVANNPRTPLKILESLVNASATSVRSPLANCTNDIDLLTQLVCDKDHNTKHNVASNLHTPQEILHKLANDSNEDVRRSVAMCKTNPEVLAYLTIDASNLVRINVVRNQLTHKETIKLLQNDTG
jgi:hypothetical protein